MNAMLKNKTEEERQAIYLKSAASRTRNALLRKQAEETRKERCAILMSRFPWVYRVVDGEMMFPRRGLFLFDQGWMINLYVTGFFKSECNDWRTGGKINSRKAYFVSISRFRPYCITWHAGVMAEETGWRCG